MEGPSLPRFLSRAALLALVVTIALRSAIPAHSAEAQPRPPAPWLEPLGSYHHAVSTRNPQAQAFFNQGMVLLYGFNHAEAIRSFEAVAALDPDCAMAHWGIAYAYGPNINQPMDASVVPLAWKALGEARRLAPKAGPREREYIEALARRYTNEVVADRAPLDRAYADAMREVMRRNADDLDAAVLFAEAVMDTMPWDYWQADRRPKPETLEIVAALRSVLRRDPDHPGAHHFFIHAVEAGPTPEDALPSADRLRQLNVGTAHLVHMPSHIYTRTGRYHDAIDVNEVAAKLDERYLALCRAQGFYPAVYYPHNLHFIWFANQMAGRAAATVEMARRMEAKERDVRCGPSPWLEAPRFRHLVALSLARFGRWSDLEALPEPGAEFPFDQAMWHSARGQAAAAQGNAAAAERHWTLFRERAGSEAVKKMEGPGLPVTRILAVVDSLLAGRVSLARGETERGLDFLRRAVEREDELPYMEPPFWHAPTRQTLGAALLAADRPIDAEGVFRAELDRNPRNGWSLHGLREALRRQGREEAAGRVDREFAASWSRADVEPGLAWY